MKDNNFIKKLILAAAAFIAQILIVMIIIFIFPDFLVGYLYCLIRILLMY